jgi:hypothetical protein
MPTTIGLEAVRRGTIVLNCAFVDQDGAALENAPSSVSWTLKDTYGNTINGRSLQPIEPPAVNVRVILSGDDLDFVGLDEMKLSKVQRIIQFNAVYDSDLGSALPLVDYATFNIINPDKVTS